MEKRKKKTNYLILAAILLFSFANAAYPAEKGGRIYQIRPKQGWNDISGTIRFSNHSGDRFKFIFSIDKRDYNSISGHYKITQKVINSICGTAFLAPKNTVNIPGRCLHKVKKHYEQLGIEMDNERQRADMAKIAIKEKQTLQKSAEEFDKTFKKLKYSDREILDTILSLVQTGIRYKEITEKESEFMGLLAPAHTLIKGFGDCDTKSLLAASFLSHWPQIKVIGIALPEHYILAADIPAHKGEATIRYKGTNYVIMETTDRWPIGQSGKETLEQIRNNQIREIDEFFQ